MNALAQKLQDHEPAHPISWLSGVGWYVVRTNIKCEFRARMGLESIGYKVFLPVEKVWIRHARRKTERVRPLFARYLFVGFDPNLTAWSPIRATDGVETLLCGTDGIPSRVPGGLIEKLKGAVEVGQFDETRNGWQGAKPGDNLQLIEGPFRDLVVQLKMALPNKRVEIFLKVLGTVRTIEVPLAWVRPA